MTKTRLEIVVRKHIHEKGITLTQLAQELGVSRVTVYNLFRGKFSRKLVEKISRVLSIPSYVLFASGHGSSTTLDEELVKEYHTASNNVQTVIRQLLNLSPTNSQKQHRPIILVVDDLQDNVDLLTRLLARDFEVLPFTDPEAALSAAQERQIDAIITDQRMPNMTGIELIAQINRLGRPIVRLMVSAYSDNQAFMDAINVAKVDAFLPKPIKTTELRDKIVSLLENRNTYIH